RTLRNAKAWLKKTGLITFSPDKDKSGKVIRWNVRRTNAPRPAELEEATEHAPLPCVHSTRHAPDTNMMSSGCLVDGEWSHTKPHDIHTTCFETRATSMSSGSQLASKTHVSATAEDAVAV